MSLKTLPTTPVFLLRGKPRRLRRGGCHLYGNPTDPFELTITQAPDDTLTTYYYDDAGRLIALERDDEWYYVATDQVGSPRAVFDTDGELVRAITYDSFGRVEADTDSSFELAIGFAGGLSDPETGMVNF